MATPKEMLDKAKSFAGRDSSDFQLVKTKVTVQAAFIGLVAGGMIGYYKKYNVYASCIIGAVACAVIANAFIRQQDQEDEI